jgi:hypothetical protein
MVIYTDGGVFIYAHHLANMRRNGGIGDQGDPYEFLVNVRIFSGPYDGKNCTGQVLGAKDVSFGTLNYKDELWDQTATGQFDASILGPNQCWSATRYIR